MYGQTIMLSNKLIERADIEIQKKSSEIKKGIINQFIWPLVGFLVLITTLEGLVIMGFFLKNYLEKRERYALEVASYTAEIFEDYSAIDWLVPYWHDHYDEMRLVYDSEETARLEAEFEGSSGYGNIRKVTKEQIEGCSPGYQLLFAEAVYARCSRKLDKIKESFGLVYSYTLILDSDGDQEYLFFFVTGVLPGEKRISQGGTLYELGVCEPYTRGKYPAFEEISATGIPPERFDSLARSQDDEYGLVHMYSPVRDKNGNIVMISAATLPLKDFVADIAMILVGVFCVTLLLILVILLWVRYYLNKVVVRPVHCEQVIIKTYAKDRNPGKAIGSLFSIRTNNELESLAEDFAKMITRLEQYESDLLAMTAENERTRTELSNAAQIQEATLPTVFPQRPEFELYALMEPAREVGGDFYDFFFLDQDHLMLLIGDVSGKGMPGALFMMTAKALLKTRALQGGTFSEILRDVNDQLTDINNYNLFVTVWMAAIDVTSGRGIASNAGHTDPIIKRAGGAYEFLRYRHDPIVGVLPGIRYSSHSFMLSPGDCIFVYTDGVPEAVNPQKELFGEERILEILNREEDSDMERLLSCVKRGIDEFAEKPVAYDDITMIGFKFYGNGNREDPAREEDRS